MKNAYLLRLVLVGTAMLASACAAAGDSSTASTSRVHLARLHRGPTFQLAPAGAQLQYFGGPVLTNVHNVPVFWNSDVQFQDNLSAFYAAVPGSALFDMLGQYSGIGHGDGEPGFVDGREVATFTDADVQSELNSLFDAGSITPPNGQTYYPVHFPAGVSITASDGSQSCVQFCAYHGTFVRNGVNVNYGVIPDQGGSCAGGCGGDAQTVNNLDSVASHELVEATTDPAVGLATTAGPPLGWYDPNNGEIGDICNAQQGTTVGADGATYVVQTEFSNAASDCVTQ
jgi:hypothetical protein